MTHKPLSVGAPPEAGLRLALEVVHGGAFTTVQAGPVRLRAAHGVSLGGAFDARSLAVANRAVGNLAGYHGLEVVLTGPTLVARAPTTFAWAGAPFLVRIDGDPVPPGVATSMVEGAVLEVGTSAVGLRCALAFSGGIFPAGGTQLRSGDTLALGPLELPADLAVNATAAELPALDDPSAPALLRVTQGPQALDLGGAARAALVESTFTVSPESDRKGVRLAGKLLDIVGADESTMMVTEGVQLGAIQVPPSGEPVILGVDRTSTGGYPKIANVISADLWRIGQLRPGAPVRFAYATFSEARALFLADPVARWLR